MQPEMELIYFWGLSELRPTKIFCDHFHIFLVAAVDQVVLVQYVALQQYIVLPILPCEMANF